MATCASDLQELDPSCAALKKKGGLKKRVWIGSYDAINAIEPPSFDVDGYVTGITLNSSPVGSPVNYLYEYIGKKLKHSGTFEGQIGENANVINQNLNLVLYAYYPHEQESIEKLYNSEEVVVFVETEAGQVEMWGYETGLKASALTGGSGTALNDSTAFTITLSGQQDTLPKKLKIGSTHQDIIDYLHALTNT